MQLTYAPGYSDFFGQINTTYQNLLQGIPSYQVIEFLIAINAELNAPLPKEENQRRLRTMIGNGLTLQNLQTLNSAFANYQHAHPWFKGDILYTKYIAAMVVEELNRNFDPNRTIITPPNEYQIIKAYLLIIDQVNHAESNRKTIALAAPVDNFSIYRILWTCVISEFEYKERPLSGFLAFRLIHLVNYFRTAYAQYLKVYLARLHFASPGEFLHSFLTLAQSITFYFPNAPFKQAQYTVPGNNVDDTHLKTLAINITHQNQHYQLPDLKKYPLFHSAGRGYAMIDYQFFLKKMYAGPFFELIHTTGLKAALNADPNAAFNTYSTIISEEVLEKKCFKEVIQQLVINKHDILQTDNGTPNCPDAYYRNNKTIFLIEFKGYIFPEVLTGVPSFNKIKKYVDDRFVENAGTPKGVSQLANQINIIRNGGFNFDPKFNKEFLQKKYTIYPIICHTDHYFSMPGINHYLQQEFGNKLPNDIPQQVNIKPLTVINLENLFFLASHSHNFHILHLLIDKYHDRMNKRLRQAVNNNDLPRLAWQYESFDQIFIADFIYEVANGPKNRKIVDNLNSLPDELNQPLP